MSERTVNLVALEDKIDWCVAALKLLLAQLPSTWEPVATVREYEGDEDETTQQQELDEVQAVQPSKPACAHRHQGIVQGELRCTDCGFSYGATGVDSAATPIRPV